MSDEAKNPDLRHAPFSDSYVALCENNPIRHEPGPGDAVGHIKDGSTFWHWWDGVACDSPEIWLPRLDQLLGLLGDYGPITLLSLGRRASHGWICKLGTIDNNGAVGRSVEEAALHLYLSLAGHLQEPTASSGGVNG